MKRIIAIAAIIPIMRIVAGMIFVFKLNERGADVRQVSSQEFAQSRGYRENSQRENTGGSFGGSSHSVASSAGGGTSSALSAPQRSIRTENPQPEYAFSVFENVDVGDSICGISYKDYQGKDEIFSLCRQTYGVSDPVFAEISSGGYYMIAPIYKNTDIYVYHLEMPEGVKQNEKLLLTAVDRPVIVRGNESGVFDDFYVKVDCGTQSTSFHIYISGKDGSLVMGDKCMEIK